jgi:hypothetical protein
MRAQAKFKALLAIFTLGVVGCASPEAEVPPPGVDISVADVRLTAPDWLPKGRPIRVLFVGNSLTESNELPAIVQALAAAGGKRIEFMSHSPGGANIDDHWTPEQEKQVLSGEKWNYVVLQQGPSTQHAGRVQLKESTGRWSKEAREHGITAALYGVWPFRDQPNGFDLCTTSYREAARANGAAFFPAGEAWRAALAAKPPIEVYGPDGLHPTIEGSYLAALVITTGLTDLDPTTLPNRVKLASNANVEINADTAKRLQKIAKEVILKHGSKSSDANGKVGR